MGSTWADYKSLTYTVMIEDQASFDQTAVRMYVAGSYSASDFVGGIHTSSSWGGERLITITDNSTLAEQLGVDGPNKWATLSNEISAMAAGYHLPEAAETGPFYLAFGPTLNPNSNRAGSITFYIKDIALVKTDGTTKLYADALDTPVGSVTVGELWCKFDVNDGTVIRTVVPEPTPAP
ncbi:MAG: hypothetical protein LBS97_05525, partial [Treponema sp.]|jgi:hypothetical protein|nr:hypothetical protein [Treponema sp.]